MTTSTRKIAILENALIHIASLDNNASNATITTIAKDALRDSLVTGDVEFPEDFKEYMFVNFGLNADTQGRKFKHGQVICGSTMSLDEKALKDINGMLACMDVEILDEETYKKDYLEPQD